MSANIKLSANMKTVCIALVTIFFTVMQSVSEGQSAPFRGMSSRQISKAIQMNTRQIFKPSFTIQSRYAGAMFDVDFSSDGRWAASSGGNQAVQLWNLLNGQRELDMRGHKGAVTALAFVPGRFSVAPNTEKKTHRSSRNGFLLSASTDGTARLWDLKEGMSIRTFRGHKGAILALAVSLDGKTLATAGQDGTVRLWNVDKEGAETQLFNNEGPIHDVAFSPDGQHILAGGKNGAKIWNRSGKGPGRELNSHDGDVSAVAWSSDGRTVAVGHKKGPIQLWTADGVKQSRLSLHQQTVNGLSFSPNGVYLASAGEDENLILWSVSQGQLVKKFEGHQKGVNGVVFSADGRLLSSASKDQTVRFWQQESGQEMARLVSMKSGWAVVAPDGRFDGTLDGDVEDRLDAIQWTGDGKVFSIDGFLENYYRPALLGRLLTGKELKSQQTGINRRAANISEGFYLPPEVKISAAPKSGSQPTMELQVNAADMGGGINEIRLYHNNKIVDRGLAKQQDVEDDKGAKVIKTAYQVMLVDGENVFKVVGVSDDRIEGEADIFSIEHSEQNKDKPTLHLFVVGINEYADRELNLNFAVPDASGILDFFKMSQGNAFETIKTYEIYNDKATRSNVDQSLHDLYRIPPEDTVVLYFAGHGEAVEDLWYFLPHELNGTDEGSIKAQGFSSEKFKEHVSRISAHKIVLLFDSCKSGAALRALSEFENKRSMALLSRSTGIHIVTATTGDQFAIELRDLKHGLFTYVLLEGLNGKADEQPEDDRISIAELLEYVKVTVPPLSLEYDTEAQTPVINSRGSNFLITEN
ncbi:MAG: caspase family protein [Magnetococcales bacterium]|nr:caspase family protein [Magnetococcales bacterium]